MKNKIINTAIVAINIVILITLILMNIKINKQDDIIDELYEKVNDIEYVTISSNAELINKNEDVEAYKVKIYDEEVVYILEKN